MKTCGVLHIKGEYKDENGCIKQDAHNDHHVYRTSSGKLIAWEDDYSCDCGCWDDYENDQDVCILYWEVDSINESKNNKQ